MSDRNATLLSWIFGKAKSGAVAATGKQAVQNGIAVGFGHGALANVLMMGGIGVVSAVSNQLEYYEGREQVREFYRDELAAKGKKDKHAVTDADLSAAEKTNHVIDGAVQRERSLRNLGVVTSFIASVAVCTLVGFAFPGGLGGAAVMQNPAIGAVVDFAAKAALGGLAYLAAKAPLVQFGTKIFGLAKETAHDLIVDMSRDRERGKSITREQVVEVFVAGNDQLADYVRASFGRDYAELTLSDKVRVASELANILPIDKIAHSINLGVTNVTELAFTVQGDVSGALPKQPEAPHQPGRIAAFAARCKGLMHSMGHMFTAEKAHPIETISQINHAHRTQQGEESPIVEMNTPGFAERVGRKPAQMEQSFADQVSERRAQQVMMQGSNTIQ